MSIGAILIMTFFTVVFGFGCVLVIADAMRQSPPKKSRPKTRHSHAA
jgi:hypothetical protein